MSGSSNSIWDPLVVQDSGSALVKLSSIVVITVSRGSAIAENFIGGGCWNKNFPVVNKGFDYFGLESRLYDSLGISQWG